MERTSNSHPRNRLDTVEKFVVMRSLGEESRSTQQVVPQFLFITPEFPTSNFGDEYNIQRDRANLCQNPMLIINLDCITEPDLTTQSIPKRDLSWLRHIQKTETIDQSDILDWDMCIESPPPPKRSGKIKVKFKYVGRSKPIPVDDPWE